MWKLLAVFGSMDFILTWARRLSWFLVWYDWFIIGVAVDEGITEIRSSQAVDAYFSVDGTSLFKLVNLWSSDLLRNPLSLLLYFEDGWKFGWALIPIVVLGRSIRTLLRVFFLSFPSTLINAVLDKLLLGSFSVALIVFSWKFELYLSIIRLSYPVFVPMSWSLVE